MTQTDTKKDKKTRQLYGAHHMAIELRYEGHSYEQIFEKIKEATHVDAHHKPKNSHRIRRWFQSGGLLEKLYLDYADKENERRRRLVISEMKKIFSQIPIKYMEIIKRETKELDPKTLVKRDSVTAKVLKDLTALIGFHDDDESRKSALDDYFGDIDSE